MTLALVLAAWTVAAVALCWANHRARRNTPRRPSYPPPVPPEVVNWIPVLPPVPQPRSPQPVPVDEWDDAAVEVLFWGIVEEVEQ